MNHEQALLRRIRWLTGLLILGLVLSGATAIPLPAEVNLLVHWTGANGGWDLARWLLRVQDALAQTQAQHPFLFYGTDWLAFGHFVIAIAFIGALRDPIRNRWLFDFGLMACVLVIPYALVFGSLRGIPFWWRLIDCSLGCLGSSPCGFAANGPANWSKALTAGDGIWHLLEVYKIWAVHDKLLALLPCQRHIVARIDAV